MVEDADSQRALGGDWRSGKNQLFDNVEARVAGQVVNADLVIRDAEVTGVIEKVEVLAAMIRSELMIISNAPPQTLPSTIEMVGFGSFWIMRVI